MATTLNIPSFDNVNIRERTSLQTGVSASASTIKVLSTHGMSAGDQLYVGQLSLERCELVEVDYVEDSTTIHLVDELKHDHIAYEAVTLVVGSTINIYRASNVDGSVPASSDFAVLITRTIDPDQQTTYYTDPDGSSSYWYVWTYTNGSNETDLDTRLARRGEDFPHYVSLSAIRREAGFQNAVNLSDVDVEDARRDAEAFVNSSLANYMTTPFVAPVPEIIITITKLWAAALLLREAGYRVEADVKLKDATMKIESLQSGDSSTGVDGYDTTAGVWGYNGTSERMFSVEDVY